MVAKEALRTLKDKVQAGLDQVVALYELPDPIYCFIGEEEKKRSRLLISNAHLLSSDYPTWLSISGTIEQIGTTAKQILFPFIGGS